MRERLYGLFEIYYGGEEEELRVVSREEERLTDYAEAIDKDKDWLIKEVDVI